MRKKTWHRLFSLLAFLFFLSGLQAKHYIAEKWEVQAAVQIDGSLWVTENIHFRFQEGDFSEVFRELPKDYGEGIVDISASMDGSSMPADGKEKSLVISGKKDMQILWRFPALSASTHLFTLKYRLLGAIRRESGADVLYWNALPQRHDFPIHSASIVVVYPKGAELIEPPEVLQGKAERKRKDESVLFLSSEIRPNQGLRLLLRFRINSAIAGPPSWQKLEEKHRQTAPYFIGVTFLMLGGGILSLYRYYFRHRPPIGEPAHLSADQPPERLSPATAGALINIGAQLHWNQVLATIIDLAQRGFLVIRETEENRWYKHTDFILDKRMTSAAELLPHEIAILNALVSQETDSGSSAIRLSQAWKQVLSRRKTIRAAMKEELRSAGMFSAERERAGRRLRSIALSMALATVFLFLGAHFLKPEYGVWPFLVPIGFLIVASGGLILASLWSPLSSTAEARVLLWKRFACRLTENSLGRGDPMATDLFERYFSYAVSFGVGSEWIEHFRIRGDLTLPKWFYTLQSGEKGKRTFSQWLHTALLVGGSRSIGGRTGRGSGGAVGGGSCGAR